MGTTGGSGAAKGGRAAPPTPAVVGTGRSMRARDVSRPRREVERRPAPQKSSDDQADQGGQGGQGKGGSSPVDS
ncbi:hypothetical protein [Kribbella sp. NPDC049584]|uniref:hypothetical protein n=1 Tax=Kribbella sp. NPDC049584 TaxID=3154833 RepID=UPI0034382CEC